MIKKSKYYIYPIILLSILVALFLISGKSNTKIKAENVSNTNDSSYLNDSDSNNSSLISKEKFELLNNFSKEKLLMQDFAIGNESDEISLTDSVSGTKHSISWQSLSTKGTYVGAGFPSYKVNNQAILSDSPYFNSQLIINGEFIEQSSDKNNIFLNAENIVYGKKVNENKLVVSFLYKGYPISIYQTLNEDKSVTVDYSIQNSTQKEKTIGLSQISSFGKEVSVVAQDSLDSILLDYKKGNDFWIETKSFNNWALGELEMIKDSTINLYEPPTIEGNGWETGIQTPKNLPVKSEESTTFKNGGLGLKTAGKIVKPEESVSFQQVIHSLVNKTTLKLNVPLTKILEKDNKEALISGEIIGSNDESYSVTIKNITNGNERVIEQTKRAIYSRSTTPKVEFSTVIPKDELSYGDNILKISAINKNGDILEENVTINYLTATSKAIVSSSSTDTISLTDDLGNKNSIGWTSSGVFDEPNVIPNYMSNDQSWMNDYGRAFGAALIVDDNPAVQYDRPGINTTTIRNIFSRAKNVVYTKDIEKRKLIVDFLYEPNASHKYKITLSQELNDDGSTFLEYTVKNNNAVTKKIGMQQSVAIKTESLKPGGSPEARVIPTNRFRGILLNYKLSKENNTFAISPIGFDNWAAGGLADVSGKNNELSIYSEVHITGKGWESGIQTPKKEKLIVGQEVLFAKQIAALTMKSIGENVAPGATKSFSTLMKYGTLRVPTLQLTKPTSTITLTSDWKEEDLNFSGNVFDPDSHDFDVILKNDRTGIEKVVAEYKDIPFSEKVEFNDTIDYNDLVTGSNSFTLFAVDNLGMSSQFKKINVNKGFSEVTVKFLNDMGEELADPITLFGQVGTKIDLTKESKITEQVNKLINERYKVSSDNATAVVITKEPQTIQYKFEGTFFIESAPQVFDFGPTNVGILPIKVEKIHYDVPLVIWDNRSTKNRKPWTLTATLESPLQSKLDPNKVLPEAIRYKKSDSETVVLSENAAMPILTHTHDEKGKYVVTDQWDKGETGLQLDIPAGSVRKLGEYEATILWKISDAK